MQPTISPETNPSRKKLYITIGGVVGGLLTLMLIAFLVAGSVASGYTSDVAEYVKRSDSALKGDDFKDAGKMKALTDSAPSLAWIPFGTLNGDYKQAQARRDALDYYTAKTTSVTTGQQDPALRDKLSSAMTDILKEYSDAAAAYNKQVSGSKATFEEGKQQDIAYLDKQIGIFKKGKETVQSLEANDFGAPLKAYAAYHFDAAIKTFEDRKAAVSGASDFSVYRRLDITAQFDSNRETYYLYRIASLAKNMYFYSWRETLSKQIDAHLVNDPFTGSRDEVQTKAELAYNADIYQRYIPKTLSTKEFDFYSMIAKYHTFLMQQALDSSESSSLKKSTQPLVDAARAESLTLAFDTQYSNKVVSISGVVDKMFTTLQTFDNMASDGKANDKATDAVKVLLEKYPKTAYYSSVSAEMTSQVTTCISERVKLLDFKTKNIAMRRELNQATQKSSNNYGALTEKIRAIQVIDDAISEQRDTYESCIMKIDLILKKFADKQNAYDDYTSSLKNTITKLVDSL